MDGEGVYLGGQAGTRKKSGRSLQASLNVVDHEVGERLSVDQDHIVRYPAHNPCSTLLSSRSLSNFA